jgi:hypothetical protein
LHLSTLAVDCLLFITIGKENENEREAAKKSISEIALSFSRS